MTLERSFDGEPFVVREPSVGAGMVSGEIPGRPCTASETPAPTTLRAARLTDGLGSPWRLETALVELEALSDECGARAIQALSEGLSPGEFAGTLECIARGLATAAITFRALMERVEVRPEAPPEVDYSQLPGAAQ